MSLSIIAMIAYGILAIAGGILGYVKSQSKASIISGSISGVLLFAAALAQLQGLVWGKWAGLIICLGLVVVFAIRFSKTKKFMPAGLMILAGLAASVGILVSS